MQSELASGVLCFELNKSVAIESRTQLSTACNTHTETAAQLIK